VGGGAPAPREARIFILQYVSRNVLLSVAQPYCLWVAPRRGCRFFVRGPGGGVQGWFFVAALAWARRGGARSAAASVGVVGCCQHDEAAASAAADEQSYVTMDASLTWRKGSCGATEFSSHVDCRFADRGAWHTAPGMNASRGKQQCARRCESCENCRFVSFSAVERDCSWYASCDTLIPGVGHETALVRQSQRKRRQGMQRAHQRRPSALLMLHVPKTGGTALSALLNGYSWQSSKWQREHGGVPLEQPIVLAKGTHVCFLAQLCVRDVLDHSRPLAGAARRSAVDRVASAQSERVASART
jgi:5-methylcytosine-specific restriction endonuclease McrA